MNISTHSRILSFVTIATTLIAVSSCNEKRFHIDGTITEAKDSTLYFEQMGLNGAVKLDSTVLKDDGTFSFDGKASDAPEFYRLRIAGQIINIAVDSTETISVKAAYPTMASGYEVSGSSNCEKIKELALQQIQLQNDINKIASDPTMSVKEVGDSINNVVRTYKERIKMEYIYKEPMRSYAYFALFQTVRIGYTSTLIFNPRSSEDDVKAFAAVATSWDAFYPNAERGANLHNIAIEGMKDIRIMRSKQNTVIDASKIDTSGIIEINLTDNKGSLQRLYSLKGKVVLLDFHLFSGEGSTKRIMMLRELYNKYHAQGLEIYQVSVDGDEHFWKLQTAALPWISVRVDQDSSDVLTKYNVQAVPTFFLLDKNANVYKRDVQIKNIDSEIKSLL